MKIDKIVTNTASPGQLVLIQGEDLAAAHKVLFGGESVPFKVNSTGGIEVTVPSSSGMVEVAVEQEDGQKTNSVGFTFLDVS